MRGIESTMFYAILFVQFILLLLLGLSALVGRSKLKKVLKDDFPTKYEELRLGTGLSDMSATDSLNWAKFIVLPRFWSDISSQEVLQRLKTCRRIEILYYINFVVMLAVVAAMAASSS